MSVCLSSFSGVYVDYPGLAKCVQEGDTIYVDDGLINLTVQSTQGQDVITTVMNNASLGQQKGVNMPGIVTELPSVTEQDVKDLRFCVQQGVDIVFASFIRRAEDIHAVRDVLNAAGGRHIKVIAKIENLEGVENYDEILDAADGVMVARGDLGIEIPPEKVFLAQKMMISKANIVGKASICATQMLESMTENPRPTRAEVSDVANAVLDGADAVMLSGETAKGKYPIEALRIMGDICQEAEHAVDYEDQFLSTKKATRAMNAGEISLRPRFRSEVDSMASAAVTASLEQDADIIIVLTNNGNSAAAVAKYRPRCPILVMTSDEHVANCCALSRGLQPILLDSVSSQYLTVKRAIDKAKELGIARVGSKAVVMSCTSVDDGFRESIEILTLG